MSQVTAADTLRGKAIRMRGQVRIADPSAQGWAGLWLRVDRTGGVPGFFDNMQNRPVRDTAWREYVIEGSVADDATQIVFGVLSVGAMTVDVDAIEIATRDAAGNWIPIAVPDASFEAAANSSSRGWSQNVGSAFIRPSSGAVHGAQFARITPRAAGGQPVAEPPADSLEVPSTGAVVDVELSSGLKARVPIALTDAEARTESRTLADLRAVLSNAESPLRRDDVDVRLADVIVTWNVFRHFYPYWGDLKLDWDARLRPQLQNALDAAETRDAHLDALRMVVADLRDGHGNVRDASAAAPGLLPVQFRILGDRLVVIASSDAAAPVGSVVTAIGGVSAATHIAKETQLASGTLQWRQSRAANALRSCGSQSTMALSFELPDGSMRFERMSCDRSTARAVESRPDSIAELEPGFWYVDLTRVRAAQLRPMLDTLARARGIVFDVRGYPTDAGSVVLPHLMRAPEDSTDRWMHVSRIARPFGEVAAWQSMTWNLRPAMPHLAGQRVFLTDGRAISYAESVMGYVRDYKLGTIIGGTTAGANGNVATFNVPGGFAITFTGMRVTRHDGRTPFHMEGVSPDVQLEPTLAGIRAGRDELLERALATLRMRP
jgi:hypothetical protein